MCILITATCVNLWKLALRGNTHVLNLCTPFLCMFIFESVLLCLELSAWDLQAGQVPCPWWALTSMQGRVRFQRQLCLDGWPLDWHIPPLLLQGSGGAAGAPGERGRTGPLGRKVCLEKGRAFLRTGTSQAHMPPLPLLSVCLSLLFSTTGSHSSLPCWLRLGQWDYSPPTIPTIIPTTIPATYHPCSEVWLSPGHSPPSVASISAPLLLGLCW